LNQMCWIVIADAVQYPYYRVCSNRREILDNRSIAMMRN